MPRRPESPRVRNTANEGSGERGTDTGNLIEPLAHLVRPAPSHEVAVKFQDLGFQHPQLSTKRTQAGARQLGHAPVAGIGNDIEQGLDTTASDPRYNAELGKVGADRMITAVCRRIRRWRVR